MNSDSGAKLKINRNPPIVAVAMRFEGKTYSLPKPYRHHDVRNMIIDQTSAQFVDVPLEDEGFLNANGRYLNRRQALAAAIINNQVLDIDKVRARILTSEDVW